MRLSGQIALITGAGQGIGKAIAIGCANAGARVALVARTTSDIQAVRNEIETMGGHAVAITADVTDAQSVAAMVQQTKTELGPVDLLVNNAGRYLSIGPVEETDPAEWWQDVTVNLLGVYLCTRQVLPTMRRRNRGRILGMIGGGSDKPLPYGTAYGVSKAALMRFIESLAAELQGTNIKVFGLRPGFVRTPMTEYLAQDDRAQRWLRVEKRFERNEDVPPQAAADLTVAIATGRFDALTGRAIRVVDDWERIEAAIPRILEANLYTLRMPTIEDLPQGSQ